MRQIRSFLIRVIGLVRRSRLEQDFTEELKSHLAFHIEDNIRAGMSPDEARRDALLRLGGVECTRQAYRDRLGLPFLETCLDDLRYAARSLGRSPLFTMVAAATLALGIGATTTMFAVAQAVLLRPLPYAEPSRLVAISEGDRLGASTSASRLANVASADVADWRRQSTVFSGMAAYLGIDERGQVRNDLHLTGIGETRMLKGLFVTNNLFDVLGVPPMLGRGFAGEDRDQVVILSYDCWNTEFAAAPNIVGRSITLGGVRREVIGVMPRGFFFPTPEVQVFIPNAQVTPDRVFYTQGVIARLRPGLSLQQARTEMAAIGIRLQQAYPKTNAGVEPRVETFHAALAAPGQPALVMVFSAVGILFLIVCSNVAHLQFGRGAARRHEFGIREALGASRARLIRQLFTESLVLSALGGLLGLLLASAARAALLRFAPEAIPSYADVRTDAWVMTFNVGITLLAPFLFGIGPALCAAGQHSLRQRGQSSTSLKRSARGWLVGAETALAVVLVVCAGLLIRSFVRLQHVDLGFRPEHTLSFRLNLGDFVPSEPQRARQYLEIESRLLGQPGIEASGATARPLLGGGSGGEASDVIIQGRERSLRLELVSPGYFLVMRTPLLRGRFLNQSDTRDSGLIAVVNAAFERVYFPEGNAVGQQIGLGGRGMATIVGVVADLKQEAIDRPAQPAAFVPTTQIDPSAVTFFVRGPGDRQALLTAARLAVHAVNKSVPLADVATLGELVDASVSGPRIRTALLSLVAGAALLLTALGIYGVLAHSVVQRNNEIGIRMALGASAPRVFRMIVLEGMRPVIMGAMLGFGAAYAASRVIRSLLFGTVPTDQATWLLTTVILAAVSLLACTIPALNAIRVDPVVSLRQQ